MGLTAAPAGSRFKVNGGDAHNVEAGTVLLKEHQHTCVSGTAVSKPFVNFVLRVPFTHSKDNWSTVLASASPLAAAGISGSLGGAKSLYTSHHPCVEPVTGIRSGRTNWTDKFFHGFHLKKANHDLTTSQLN